MSALSLASLGFFYVGGRVEPSLPGEPTVGQMYVEYLIPERRTQPWPIVLVHGGAQTGTNFLGTPDGREGWAQLFARAGYAVYVVDQVARGRSPHWSDAHGPMNDGKRWNSFESERRFGATSAYELWPQASLHTQFPGTGLRGDAVFDAFCASQIPSLADFAKQQEINRDALIALFEKIGGGVLLTHSQAGAFGWLVADARPDLVRALVAVEPHGPPVHSVQEGVPGETWYRDENELKRYGLTFAPLTYDPPVTESRPLKFVREDRPAADNFVRCWSQAEPPAKLPRLARVPIAIITGEASYHAPYDHCTSAYLSQAGVAHSFIRLADEGIRGNGHMMMIEKNSAEIAALIDRWLSGLDRKRS